MKMHFYQYFNNNIVLRKHYEQSSKAFLNSDFTLTLVCDTLRITPASSINKTIRHDIATITTRGLKHKQSINHIRY